MKLNFTFLLLVASLALALSACGGGGGDAPASAPANPVSVPATPVSVPPAQGVYSGTLSNGGAFEMLALENGEVWAMYGSQTGSTFLVRGFVQGTFSDAKDFGYAPARPVTITSQYDAASKAVQGSIAASGSAAVGFNGGPIAGSFYNYDEARQIGGSWILQSITGETLSFNVSALGVVNGSGSSGCHYSGFVTPRPSGKNVSNVSLTFAGAPCILAGQQVSGVAVVYAIDLLTTQLVVGLVDASGTVGLAAVGTRM